MFMMAPFYVFRISQQQIEQFPGHVKLIMQVYQEDDCNDHRMAKDIFETISIDNAEKDFILMMSDSSGEYAYTADHGTPYGFGDENGEVDGLDFYGIYRLVDALADYTFRNNQDAKAVALGNGDIRQLFMGQWPDSRPVRELIVSDTPEMVHHHKWYFFHWRHPWNPRRRIQKRAERKELIEKEMKQ